MHTMHRVNGRRRSDKTVESHCRVENGAVNVGRVPLRATPGTAHRTARRDPQVALRAPTGLGNTSIGNPTPD